MYVCVSVEYEDCKDRALLQCEVEFDWEVGCMEVLSVGPEVGDTKVGGGTGVDFGGEDGDTGVFLEEGSDTTRGREERDYVHFVLPDPVFLQDTEGNFGCCPCVCGGKGKG